MAELDPPPSELWRQAHREHIDNYQAGQVRYIELMHEHGYIIKKADDPKQERPSP